MNKVYKSISLVMVLLLIIGSFVGCATKETAELNEETGKYTDGTYQGKGEGKGGEVLVQVVVKNGDIDDVKILKHNETEMISDPAISKIVKAVIENKSVNVDVVSGATMTSEAILEGIKDALVKAGGSEEVFKKDKQISLSSKEEEQEMTYDVVIIGAGGAGLSAAVEARNTGADVVVLEKMPAVGGNTLVSGGGLNVPGSEQQKANGINDTVESFIKDTLNGGDNINDEKLVKVMAENALSTAEWLVNNVGVEFMPERLQQFGGHSVPRALIAKSNHGTELIKKLKKQADDLGVDFKMDTKAEELVVDENNKVVSVKAVNVAGQELIFNANKGVVISTGGFGANVEMRKKYNPEMDERYMTTDVPATTGDGIVMAQKVGADTRDMKYIQTYPLCNPKTGIISYVANSRFDGAILVNKEGSRFVEEMGRRDVISKSILDQTGSSAYLIWGQEIEQIGKMTEVHKNEYSLLEKDDLIYKADNIEDLAKFFDIETEELKNTINKYNSYVENGMDKEFNRRGNLRSIKEGPYYVQNVIPSIHHTMGGVVIDSETHVLDGNGNIISGLFAAGEVVGGVHGTNRLGGNAVTDVVVFGRIAGKNVVK